MIITLKGADFSNNNIGPLSSWLISREIGDGARYSGPVYVTKGLAYSASVVIGSGYRLGAEGIKVYMGDIELENVVTFSDDNKTLIISIPEATGNIFIKVATESTAIYYTITYNYMDEDGNVLTAPETEKVLGGTEMVFDLANTPAIYGYAVSSVSPTSATIDKDTTVTYYYTATNLMATNARLDANTTFTSGTASTTEWGAFRGATAVVENDYVKISCENSSQGLTGIRMGVPAGVSALPTGTQVKIEFDYRHDESYTPAGEYKFYVTSSAASFAYTTEWQHYSKEYTWDGAWDRLQISAATTNQKEAIFYVKNFSITIV